MKYDIFLFDLDGTLTNPELGITTAVQYALTHFNIAVSNLKDLTKFIGPPLRESFSMYYDLTKEESEVAVSKYREYYSATGIFQNEVYNHIPKLLKALKSKSKTLAVATSKPTVYAVQILQHFNLIDYFALIVGSELDGSREKKGDIIKYTLDELDPKRLKRTVMIGDREHDIIGAKENNIDSVGVTYGFGSYEELKSAGAKLILDIDKLLSYFTKE